MIATAALAAGAIAAAAACAAIYRGMFREILLGIRTCRAIGKRYKRAVAEQQALGNDSEQSTALWRARDDIARLAGLTSRDVRRIVDGEDPRSLRTEEGQ